LKEREILESFDHMLDMVGSDFQLVVNVAMHRDYLTLTMTQQFLMACMELAESGHCCAVSVHVVTRSPQAVLL
jgi:hypothetical protein